MTKKKLLWVRVDTNNSGKFFLKLNDLGVNLIDNKIYPNFVMIKICNSDYVKIKKYLISYKSSFYSYSGWFKLVELVKKYRFFLVSFLVGIIMIILANNLVFKIVINTSNKEIEKIVQKELSEQKITVLSFKKHHKQIEKIVKDILNKNKGSLEWLEISYDGAIMIVNVTEKTKTNKDENYSKCNIVAKTDAKIISLNIYRGMALKEINDYVNKNDIIISGDINFNEEVKNEVCAEGMIFGEVWYKVKVTVPLVEHYIHYTGKNRYNLEVKFNDDEYKVFKSRIQNKREKKINIYELEDFEINLIKEREYNVKKKNLTEKEAYNKGILLATNKVALKLKEDEEILLKKVLKKEVNDSTIYLEVFIVTKENIAELQIVK